MAKATKFIMDEKQLNEVIELAAKTAVEAYRSEHEKMKKERGNRILNNAKKLMVNYRRFKAMCVNATFDIETTSDFDLEEILALMSGKSRDTDLEVLSIKQKTARTKLIVEHIDTMLGVYEKHCSMSNDIEEMRRWNVIYGLYISDTPMTVQEIAERECITVSTVYRDCDKACKKLSILLFGIDGMN